MVYWKTRRAIENAFYLCGHILHSLANYLENQIKYIDYLDYNKVDDVININEIKLYSDKQIKKFRKQLKILTEEFENMRKDEK